MSFSEPKIQAMTLVEQMFWEEGCIPTDEAIAEATGIRLETITGYWKDPEFRTALIARGVTFDNQRNMGKALSMEQLMVANMLMNTTDRRSLREKLKEFEGMGLTVQKVSGWMRQPAFQEHLMRRAQTLYEHAKPAAYRELVKAVESGDPQMLKLFFEMTGIYNPKLTVEVDVNVILTRVVEIIQKHVPDPATLTAIAAELEALEAGEPPTPTVQTPIPAAVNGGISLNL